MRGMILRFAPRGCQATGPRSIGVVHNDARVGLLEDDEEVPLFGTWGRIYAAVVICAFLVMGLVTLFSHWDY